jgi:hypothetical protein
MLPLTRFVTPQLTLPCSTHQETADYAIPFRQLIHRASPIQAMLSYFQNLARRATQNSAHQYVLGITLNLLLETLAERGLPVTVSMLERLGRDLDENIPVQIMARIHQELQANPILTLAERKILLLALVNAEERLEFELLFENSIGEA